MSDMRRKDVLKFMRFLAILAIPVAFLFASCDLGDDDDPVVVEEGDAVPRFAYVTNDGDDTVTAYAINSTTGALTAGDNVATGHGPKCVALNPSGKFAYVANSSDNTLSIYTVNHDNGALTPAGHVDTGPNPRFLVFHQTKDFAYVANYDNNSLTAYSYDSASGALTPVGDPVASGSGPNSITIDSTGKFAYSANSLVNSISVFSINQDTGVLTASPDREIGGPPRSVVAHPSGNFVYTFYMDGSNDTVNGHDGGFAFLIQGFNVNTTTGALTSNTTNAVHGHDPSNDPYIHDTHSNDPYTAMAMDPLGRYIFATTNQYNPSMNYIVTYSINQTTGALTEGTRLLIDSTDGKSPVGVTVDPSGEFVYVIGNASDAKYVFRYSIGANGVLTAGTKTPSGTVPSAITTTAPTGL